MFPASLAFTVAIAAVPNGGAHYFSGPSQLFQVPQETKVEESRSACSNDRTLCYDPTTHRIVYKPARAWMPDIPGLTRDNISVKRDRISLRYTF